MASEHPLCREKTDGGLEKRLANQRSASRIAKKPHVSRGQETKWEIPDKVSISGLLIAFNMVADELGKDLQETLTAIEEGEMFPSNDS